MPTLPSHQFWAAIQLRVSSPSSVSKWLGIHAPPLLFRPRTSWSTTA